MGSQQISNATSRCVAPKSSPHFRRYSLATQRYVYSRNGHDQTVAVTASQPVFLKSHNAGSPSFQKHDTVHFGQASYYAKITQRQSVHTLRPTSKSHQPPHRLLVRFPSPIFPLLYRILADLYQASKFPSVQSHCHPAISYFLSNCLW